MVRIRQPTPSTNRDASDLPVTAAQDGYALAVSGYAVDVHLVRPDHEIDVLAALVDARHDVVVDQELEPGAERDVACRVLVQKRVVEVRAERADAPLPIDERELAEPERALIDLEERRQRVAVRVGIDLDRLAVLEAHAQATHDRAVPKRKGLGRRHLTVRSQRIG